MSMPLPICMRIWGGLGNQMFQYAAGHALARQLGADLLIDPIAMDLDHAHFGLDIFGLDVALWKPEETGSKPSFSSIFRRGKFEGKKRAKLWAGPRFTQTHFCHADAFGDIEPGTYVNGYFQSEQFFADYADEIKALYALENIVKTIDPALMELARRPDSVSVHIRRGDYATNKKTLQTHGILDAAYYGRAGDLMSRLVPDAHWLVFSDDLNVADELTRGLGNRTLIAGHTREQDLCLMARCANHVIANSSFSWWGAWLGRNPRKSVIAPRQWFSRAEMRNVYVDELYPDGWILL